MACPGTELICLIDCGILNMGLPDEARPEGQGRAGQILRGKVCDGQSALWTDMGCVGI